MMNKWACINIFENLPKNLHISGYGRQGLVSVIFLAPATGSPNGSNHSNRCDDCVVVRVTIAVRAPQCGYCPYCCVLVLG